MGKSKSKGNSQKKKEKSLQALEKRLQALRYPAKIGQLPKPGELPTLDELPSPTTLIESVAPIADPETISPISSLALKKLEAVLSAPVLGSQPLPQVETKVAIPIIEFVEEVEKSHQYFLFKEYLRADCPKIKYGVDLYDLSYELIKENQRGHRFNLLEDEEVEHCVHDYLFELRAKHYMDRRNNRRKNHEKNGQQDNNMFNLLSEEESEEDSEEDIPDFDEMLARKTDLFAARAPVQYMVYRAREEGYVMDEDPEAELKKLKKLAPMFYNEHLIRREPHVEAEARTLIISNLSPELSEKDFRAYLGSCGRVEDTKLQSVAQGKIGYVTFKKLSSADYAQNRYHGIGISHLSIETSYSRYAPLQVRRQSLEAVPVVKDVRSMYAAALNKYSALRAYLLQVESKVVRPFSFKEFRRDFQNGCHLMVAPKSNWMAVEAMANGGYRQDGGIWRHVPEDGGVWRQMAVDSMAKDGYRQDGGIWRLPEPHLRPAIFL